MKQEKNAFYFLSININFIKKEDLLIYDSFRSPSGGETIIFAYFIFATPKM